MARKGSAARPEKDRTPKIKADLVELVRVHGAVVTALRDLRDAPAQKTVYRWMSEDQAFKEAIYEAASFAFLMKGFQMFAVLEDNSEDLIENERVDEYGHIEVHRSPNTAAISRRRALADKMQWALSKLKPERFADKIIAAAGGQAGDFIVQGFAPPEGEDA